MLIRVCRLPEEDGHRDREGAYRDTVQAVNDLAEGRIRS
jgi:hypothetical protein